MQKEFKVDNFTDKNTVDIKGDLIIYPNIFSILKGYNASARKRIFLNEIESICKNSGIDYDVDKDELVAIDIFDEGMRINSPKPIIIDSDKRFEFRLPNHIPYKLVKDYNIGDTIDITYTTETYISTGSISGYHLSFNVNLHLTVDEVNYSEKRIVRKKKG